MILRLLNVMLIYHISVYSICNKFITYCLPAGTSLYYQPGILHGGDIEHDCSLQRSIGYYLEMLVCLAPFCKKSITATLRGITSSLTDPSVGNWAITAYLR